MAGGSRRRAALIALIVVGGLSGTAGRAGPSLVAAVGVGVEPWGVAVNPSTDRVYVANFAGPGSPGTVTVFDGTSRNVVTTLPVGAGPVGVAVDPTAGRAYAASAVGESLTVINSTTNSVIGTITGLDTGPYGVAANPATGLAYAGNFDPEAPGVVWVIDGGTLLLITTVAVGGGPHHVAANPATNRIYVSNAGAGTLSVIDGGANAVVATAGVGASPQGVAVDPGADRIYVANRDSDSVSVVDGASSSVLATIPVDDRPTGVAIDTSTKWLYVTHDAPQNSVTVIDATSLGVLARFAAGPRPRGVAADPVTNRAYVSNFDAHTVSVVERVAPPAPVITRPVTGGFAGVPSLVEGTSVPNVTVGVYEGVTLLASATATGAGIWATTISLAPGAHTITPKVTDSAGDVSAASAAVAFTVDATPPVSTIDPALVVAPLLPVTGTATDAFGSGIASVTVIFDPLLGPAVAVQADVTCTDATRQSCAWAAHPPGIPGIYAAGARSTDRAGNVEFPGPAVFPILVV